MTGKLVVFASAIGNDVIDLIPIAQIVAIRSASNTTTQSQQQISALDDENDNENEGNDSQPPANTSKGKLEMTLQTEQRGYNSGRAYRVSPISSCLVFFRYGCSLGRSQVRVASERDRQQLEDSLSAAVAAERKRMQSKSFKKAVQSRVPHAWAPWRAGARLMRATAPNTDARPAVLADARQKLRRPRRRSRRAAPESQLAPVFHSTIFQRSAALLIMAVRLPSPVLTRALSQPCTHRRYAHHPTMQVE